MKIGILSRAPRSYSTKRLVEVAKARGHKVRVLDTMRFAISIQDHEPDLFYKGRRVSHYDAIIPRVGASVTFFGTAVVRQFEQMGVFVSATSQAITVSRDKLRTMQILSRHSLGIPDTAFVRDRYDVLPAIERVGGAPVVIKLLEGTQGTGVILAETQKVAEAIIETLQSTKQNVLIQKFVSESKGKDIRAFVVGDRVVAAMRRTAQGQEFRSNVHRGGQTEPVELDETYQRTAIHAANILGLSIAGVDMLESSTGPQVMEVNSSPGLEGIETATGLDIASEIIAFIEEQIMFPVEDYRQRLSIGKGYTIAEVPVPKGSELAGKTLADTRLRDRDISVLSILRGDLAIPNPRGWREILVGDRLVCFGKQISLKALIPPRKRTRRRVTKKKR